MRQKRSSRCRALVCPAARVRVEGPRNPWDGWHGLRAEAGAPRSPSVRTLLRSPAARGVEMPAARGGSTPDPSAVIPPPVLALPGLPKTAFPSSPAGPARPRQCGLSLPERASLPPPRVRQGWVNPFRHPARVHSVKGLPPPGLLRAEGQASGGCGSAPVSPGPKIAPGSALKLHQI